MELKNIRRILIASGSFKDVFSPQEACYMIHNILIDIIGNTVEIDIQPMVDGGECSSEVLSEYFGYEKKILSDIVDPAGFLYESKYLQIDTNTVYISTSSTLALPSKYGDELRNPLFLTSYGLGQLIRYLHERSITNIIIGFGGTSTVDAGIGMLQAFGAIIYDTNEMPLIPFRGNYYTGADLKNVRRIDCDKIRNKYSNISIWALCDAKISIVDINTPTALKVGKYYENERAGIVRGLVTALMQFSSILEKQEYVRLAINNWPGDKWLAGKDFFGVAGGTLLSMVSVFNVTPVLGVDYFIENFKIKEKVERADVVISGEGCFDNSLDGKTLFGIAGIAKKYHKPLIYLCGTVGESYKQYFQSCIGTNLPKEILMTGINTIISCHPEYKKELSEMTYNEEMAYYRQETPKILRNALGELFRVEK